MNKLITFVYAYYDNPNMFLRQMEEWNVYPNEIKKQLDIIVTDDCSKDKPLSDLPLNLKNIDIRRFQITEKVQWNWLACRNIGASKANTKWLLLTDMDHMVDSVDIGDLFNFLNKKAYEETVYLFKRVDAPNRTKFKSHDDSYLMTKEMYWKIGGYDEELSGNYGTSGRYRKRAFQISDHNKRLNIPLTRFPSEVIFDANTKDFVRKHKNNGKKIKAILRKKTEEGRLDEIRTLSFPYKEIKL